MRFALVTDFHYGPAPHYFNENRIMSERAPEVINKLINRIKGEKGLSFMVQLGDLIQDDLKNPSAELDRKNIQEALSYFKDLQLDTYHVIGNHEQQMLNEYELNELFGLDRVYYSFSKAGYRCLVLFSHAPDHKNMVISDEQVEWVKSELQASQLPVLIFVHHAINDQNLDEHYWFKGRPDKVYIQNRDQLHSSFVNSGKVKGVFYGHMHYHTFSVVDGIPYFSLQSAVEDFQMNGNPSTVYALVEIDEMKLKIEAKGNNPVSFLHRY